MSPIILTSLTAALNAKPPECGQSTLTAQFLEPEQTVRVALWGELRFMQAMLGFVAALTGEGAEDVRFF